MDYDEMMDKSLRQEQDYFYRDEVLYDEDGAWEQTTLFTERKDLFPDGDCP